MECRVCRNKDRNSFFTAKEMMFGLREGFEYMECGACRCLQIKEYLKDPGPYYPTNYYSVADSGKSKLINRIKALRNKLSMWPTGILGYLVNRYIPENRYQSLRILSADKSLSILDIGAGSGEMLKFLNSIGFTNLTGIDPFIPADIHYNKELNIYRKNIFEIEGKFDFIMMHHAFEHMENPEQVFAALYSLLSDKGILLIRIPVAPSFAYEKYGSNWVQLDAPRHLYIHSIESIRILCSRNALEIFQVIFDSRPFQFWGSEMYKDNIPLLSRTGFFAELWKTIRYKAFRNYNAKSMKLNRDKMGDQAAFYIRKSNI